MFSIFTTSLLAVPVLAQPGSAKQRGPDRLADELNLTADQKQQFEAIHADAAKEQIDRRAAISKARVELQQLLRTDKPDQSSIEKKVGEIAGLESQIRTKRIDTWFRVNRLLNADQQLLWKKGLEQRMVHGRRSAMKGRMHRAQPGSRFDGRMRERMDRPGPRR